jgi:hypothetical protein
MLFKEIIGVYSEPHTERISTFYGQNAALLIAKGGGIYNYNKALKG